MTVITVGGSEKRGVNSPALYADWAVLDAELTLTLPRHVTAATGIDAMVHAIEAYTSARLKNPMSDMFARKAMRLISDNLLRACDHPDDAEARGKMLLAAHLAGIAFANAPVAGVHALAYPLGGHFHVPHGLSNALMLTHVLGHNMEAARPLYAELGAMLDPSVKDIGQQGQAQAFVQHLARLGAGRGRAAAPVRGRHRARASRPARRRGDEAGAAAGQQSLPDQRGRRAAALRGGALNGGAMKGRGAYPVWREIATRWADNDAYGHVNNTVYYAWFDTAVNALADRGGAARHRAWRPDRPRRRDRLPLRALAHLSRAGRDRPRRRAARHFERHLPARRLRQGRGGCGRGGAFHPCLCRERQSTSD